MAYDPLPMLVHEATQPATRVIAVLHGHGDDPRGLLDRVARLVPDDIAVLAPTGPVRTAAGAPAWFASADGDRADRSTDEGSLPEAIHRLAVTFSTLAADDAPSVLLGYSQGAATALALAFGAAPEPRWRPATVGTIAGWLPSDPEVEWDVAGAAGHTRAVLVHAEDDEVVDAQMGRSAARVLDRGGVEVAFVEVPGGHAVTDDGIMRLLA